MTIGVGLKVGQGSDWGWTCDAVRLTHSPWSAKPRSLPATDPHHGDGRKHAFTSWVDEHLPRVEFRVGVGVGVGVRDGI